MVVLAKDADKDLGKGCCRVFTRGTCTSARFCGEVSLQEAMAGDGAAGIKS